MTYWHDRWAEGRTGFDQPEANSRLMTHWPRLVPEVDVPVLVPLCGKSQDMIWLHRRGHAVVGIELVEQPCHAFFEEHGLAYEVQDVPGCRVFKGLGKADGIRLLCGDMFTLDASLVGPVGAWFDRAAIVALPPEQHGAYAQCIAGWLPGGAPGLMLTFEYPKDVRNGVPYSVGAQDVEGSFGHAFEMDVLEVHDLTEGNRWEMPWVHEPVIRLRRKS